MRKVLLFMILAVSLTGCYEDFRVDYTHTTVAFAAVEGGSDTPGVLWRSVVKGEGLDLDVGVYLAGVIENEKQRWVSYTIDPSLLQGTQYELLPEDYYSLSNSEEFVIPAGEFVGKINIELDSTKFIGDPLTTQPHYAIPFRLTETSEDSILSTADTRILVLKYMNQYEGAYIQEGTYKTYSAEGEVINSGEIDNVINATTTGVDTVATDGMVFKGPDYMMKLNVQDNGEVTMEYYPNPNPDNAPKNIAMADPDVSLSTSYVSPWESLAAIKDGYEPTSSTDKGPGAYGNWPNPETWNWVQYDFGQNVYNITKSEVYWWTDNGGILIPYDAYLEYWDIEAQQWVRVESTVGVEADKYNVTDLSVVTNKLRLHFIATEAQGILEWKVWGTPVPTVLEQAPVESITALPNADNIYNDEEDMYILNYRIDYQNADYYTIVSTTLDWRNRIRDGVNEWRR